MNIIWEKPTDEMFDKYLILDLEPNVIDGNLLDTWCVVEATKIPLAEVVMLDHWKKLHGDFVQANKDGDSKLCNDLAEHLTGKFGGDLDTFYQEVCNRFHHQQY